MESDTAQFLLGRGDISYLAGTIICAHSVRRFLTETPVPSTQRWTPCSGMCVK